MFRLGVHCIIATWSTPGWLWRFTPELMAETSWIGRTSSVSARPLGVFAVPQKWPSQIGPTINQARGVHPQIADRFDLTLECIRRHYLDPDKPNLLSDRLRYYGDFFALFRDFDAYVRFFLLDDLLTPDRDAVRSLFPGDVITGFTAPAHAVTPEEYSAFRLNSLEFVQARSGRIRALGL